MTDEIELARRAVACDGWRWMPGMLTDCGLVVYAHDHCSPYLMGVRLDDTRVRPECLAIPHDALPNLTDPATLGCVLALVREVWGDPLICTAVDNTGAGWWVEGWADKRPDSNLHDTEAAALVAALEAAPVGGVS